MTKIKILTCCLFFFFTLPVLAQKEGLRFFKGSWLKAMEEARKSNKLIFVNVYAEWSESSQKMKEEIFPLKLVGDKYNNQFINYRVDGDWREGEFFDNRYRIDVYPTFLYLNGDGAVVFRSSGYREDPMWFISLADTALYIQEAKQTMPAWRASYPSRKNDKEFVGEYLNRLILFEMSADTIDMVRDHFFSQLSPAELKDSVTAGILLRSLTTVLSPAFKHIMANQSSYRSIIPDLSLRLGSVIINSIIKATASPDDDLFRAADAYSNKLENPLPRYPYLVFLYRNEYYIATKQSHRMIERAPAFLDSICRIREEGFRLRDQQLFEEIMRPYTSGEQDSTQVEDFSYLKESSRTYYSRYVASVLNKTASHFLNYALIVQDHRKACVWAARAVDLDVYNYAYYTTLSQLYAKVGMKKEAVSTMETAIKLAKEQGVSDTIIKIYKNALKTL
ncbi:thioredoxin family protein [Chitinophaga niabensis]|uniref:Thioredoxin-like n=1 Tax=Chitinophaga niabensis TaxID=536979 RepID=A0A1N6G5N1_9BACT|nr:thioredoxin family protein [Chitinophaga niabensis]SIO02856.1 Thioredoxin-like [Chitinophaga niabensis]